MSSYPNNLRRRDNKVWLRELECFLLSITVLYMWSGRIPLSNIFSVPWFLAPRRFACDSGLKKHSICGPMAGMCG